MVLLGLRLALISRGARRSARTHKELRALREDQAIAPTRATADPVQMPTATTAHRKAPYKPQRPDTDTLRSPAEAASTQM